ncbi:2-amino-4-hydroxy-6-hydroxymethyldihydropteridine diphosphokinase [Bacteroides sp. 214]|uniref:2-amino-4-hydroxy-6- hydroxymethyldihydropteridine diphosphokinase n=1 Tax=Bacteroides sp. 214 TaxID=2302935 RepID=UPI0013D17B96|nr:2-amino-4-hydroxy-6-hydroxymethyldihydropteridine diphosphokinase [Bacteroides sp. 214]NDW11950.1 2-amino-4-hydroxy-6-hydroxymethyldihydropteridine diphosphokinase [Bacteroides sp. 214]
MHTCLICIGSNYNRKENLALAAKWLREAFCKMTFGSVQETEPIGIANSALFFNQLVEFRTQLDKDTVVSILKSMEIKAGRTPEDKAQGKVILDIDLLLFDDKVLKSEEMNRTYIIKGINELRPHKTTTH